MITNYDIFHNTILTPHEPRAYCVDPESKVLGFKTIWLQQCLIWALKKLGAEYLEPVDTVCRVRIDTEKLVNNILAQRESILRNRGPYPSKVLIGPKTLDALMEETIIPVGPEIGFEAQYEVMEGRPGHRGRIEYTPKILGLKVIVVPQMEGMLVR